MTKVLLEEIPSSDREGYDREVHRRALALHAVPAAVNERLQIVLQGDDKAALCGLAENRSLPMEYLIRARNRLYDLDDNVGAWSAQQTIEEARKTQVPEDPADLFGEEGRRGKFSQDKIDFIGTRLLSFEREITRRLKLLVIGIAIAIGIALFPLLWSVYTLIR